MKVISKKEFQDAYISPTEEQSARMQAKLNSLQQEPEERRHVLRAKPRLAFIMAALLVIAGITAIAASTIRYQTTWGGEVREYEPRDDDEESDAFFRGIPDEIFTKADNASAEGFYVSVSGPHETSVFRNPCLFVNSEEDLLAQLDKKEYPHPASLVPEGYIFEKGIIRYDLFNDEKKDLADSMTVGDYSLKIYSVEPENKYINGFYIAFSKEEKENSYTWIEVGSRNTKDETMYFNTDESYSVETLSVPWMEDAFLVRTDKPTKLYMLKNIKGKTASFIGIPPKSEMIYLSVSASGAVDDVLNSDWGHWR